MATLGITYFLDGAGQTLFGSDIYKIDIGMPKDPIFLLEEHLPGRHPGQQGRPRRRGHRRLRWWRCLRLFFQKTATGRALRAVADDHQAAQSIGIPLNRIWVIVWSVAGVVALVAGIIWGSKLGVQFSLSLVALKALPVVILGGLTSVPGAIIGGLIIGVGEKLSEVYIGPYFGGGIEIWFAYVLGAGVPAGPAAGPVRREDHRSGLRRMLYRENGQFKTSYRADQQVFPITQDRVAIGLLIVFAVVGVPLLVDEYLFRAILIPFLILSLAALGLNILVGYCGQISLGTGAFMAVGAYAAYNFMVRIDGMPLLLAFLLGGLCATIVGVLFGIPSLRIKGLYLAVATLAAQFFVDWSFLRIKWFTNDSPSGSVSVADARMSLASRSRRRAKYLFCLAIVVLFALAREEPGARPHRPRMDGHPRHGRRRGRHRHPPGVRQAHRLRRQLASSSASPARCGASCTWARGSRRRSIDRSFQLLFMIIIGGLGSIMGSFFGAAFIVVLPIFLNQALPALGTGRLTIGTRRCRTSS